MKIISTIRKTIQKRSAAALAVLLLLCLLTAGCGGQSAKQAGEDQSGGTQQQAGEDQSDGEQQAGQEETRERRKRTLPQAYQRGKADKTTETVGIFRSETRLTNESNCYIRASRRKQTP